MGDQGFDYCEFVWNHMTIQRLMSILRQTQAYCTDNECFNYPRLPGPQTSTEPSSDYFFMTIAFIIMMLLYVFRPNSLRKKENEMKIRNNALDSNDDNNDDPPAPPPPAIN